MKTSRILALLFLLHLFFACKQEPKPEAEPEIAAVKEWKPEDTRSITGVMSERGLIVNSDKSTDGLVLMVPSESDKTYLINKEGLVVHSWESELSVIHAYLMENGNLIRLELDPDFPTFAAGGQCGRIREYDWDGNLLWDFKLASATELTHHDIEIMPNGNILAIAYEAKSKEEAIQAGRNPEHTPKAGVWPDQIIEIKPTKPEGGEIVWEWHMWDHLIQDFDDTKDNYGVVADNPRKININAHEDEGPPMTAEQIEQLKKAGLLTANASADNEGSDITHTNAISYNAELDQIAISVPHMAEIFIIDHSTSTEEAKGSTGGRWGHGGDLLFRWGNPANYNRGSEEDRILYYQHDIKWIPEGFPGAGNMMVFNNDIKNPNNNLPSMWAAVMQSKSVDPQVSIADVGNHSEVIEFTLPVDEAGGYVLPADGPFDIEEVIWNYTAPDKYSFYSAFVSGAQRMPNGHTLITSGAKGRFFEVTPEKEIVWEYRNPYNFQFKTAAGYPAQPAGPFLYMQFRSTYFPADFPAFSGKEIKPLESQPEPFVYTPPPMPQDSTQTDQTNQSK